jgi:chemotaxis protein methyltransferase CheR
MILTPELYGRYIDLIYKKTGLWFEPSKRYFVDKRIEERIEGLGLESFKEYYQLLKFSNDDLEMQKLINRLTVNETYFFRDFPQLQSFAEGVLPEVVKIKENEGNKKIRFWSAGCSTGEEPYTMAIIFLEMLPNPEEWTIEILATDINTQVLNAARKGGYSSRSVKDVPPEYLERYFVERLDTYYIKKKIKDMVQFKTLNLVDGQAMLEQDQLDFIFCRNVLIYFNPESRAKVVNCFYHSLKSRGVIYLGHSESISRITNLFKIKRIGGNTVYCKP